MQSKYEELGVWLIFGQQRGSIPPGKPAEIIAAKCKVRTREQCVPDGVTPLRELPFILCCDLAGSVFGFNRGTQSSSPHLHVFL